MGMPCVQFAFAGSLDRPEVATDVSPVEAPAFRPDEDAVTVVSPAAPSLLVCKSSQRALGAPDSSAAQLFRCVQPTWQGQGRR